MVEKVPKAIAGWFPLFRADLYQRRFGWLMAAMFVVGPILLLLSAATGAGGDLIVGDARDTFEYARSLAVEGRLPERHIRYPCGPAMIGALGYFPSVLINRLAAHLGWASPDSPRDGWALVHQFSYCLPFILLAAWALRLNLLMLRHLGLPDSTIKPVLLFWVAGTNIGYYVFKEPAMSETSTYCSLSLYYFLLLKHFRPRAGESSGAAAGSPGSPVATRHWMQIGLALGLAGIIRQQNILHGLAVPILAAQAAATHFPTDRRGGVLSWLRAVGTVAVAGGLVFLIPYAAWAASEGDLRLYSYSGERFDFLHPHLIATLFSPLDHGLFVWTPIYLLAACGLVPFFRKCPSLIAPLLVPVLLQYTLISSWWAYSFGSSVGHRGFFTILPILLLGLASLFDAMATRGRAMLMTAALFILTCLNLLLLLLISMKIVPV